MGAVPPLESIHTDAGLDREKKKETEEETNPAPFFVYTGTVFCERHVAHVWRTKQTWKMTVGCSADV